MGDERQVTINTGDTKPAAKPEESGEADFFTGIHHPAELVTVTISPVPPVPAPKPVDPRVIIETQRG